MKIGIIVAMSKELALLMPLLENKNITRIDGYEFFTGHIGKHDVVAMECGIGKVNAAMGTYTLLSHFPLDLVLSTGVAGGADPEVNVMDVVVADRIAYHDVWCGPETIPGQAAGMPEFFTSCNRLSLLLPPSDGVKHGLLCSGDMFIDSIEQVNEIKRKFPDALAVDMESAAIAHVCCKKGVDFFCMRIISDSPGAGHNNAVQYDNFWADAPKHTFALVKQLLLAI
ncbi:MAG: 5'-methylthioadenosine/adenosylhomocysteine nucleosidase [Muribaculaceae bacterium]